ncbi:branched-chain amino acid ABC transporter permease [Neobacillus sp. NPDC097160]|uniref:branched-chain amino acid ABC transporter permease n=1 Tax=Neobacillus sp. NPDC097160 TaxID=3364298 RepID=UPI0038161175
MDKKNLKILSIIAVLIGLLPLFLTNPYYVQILINIGTLTVISLGLTVLLGFTGQISFAQVTFFGIGAYTAAITTVTYGWPPLAGLLMAAIVSGFLAFLIGLPVLRFKEHFLALITIGFAVMVYVLMVQLADFTGGPGGFSGIPPFSIAGVSLQGEVPNYYLIWFFALFFILIISNLLSSRIGRALESLRSSEIAAKSMGINAFTIKLKAFIFAGIIAGVGGSLYAFQTSFIAPNTFEVMESMTFIIIVVVGGLRSLWGAPIGAVVITAMDEGMTHFLPLIIPNAGGEVQIIAYGILLVLVLLFIPNGIGPTLGKLIKSTFHSKAVVKHIDTPSKVTSID